MTTAAPARTQLVWSAPGRDFLGAAWDELGYANRSDFELVELAYRSFARQRLASADVADVGLDDAPLMGALSFDSTVGFAVTIFERKAQA